MGSQQLQDMQLSRIECGRSADAFAGVDTDMYRQQQEAVSAGMLDHQRN
jgi:hypothetical protein